MYSLKIKNNRGQIMNLTNNPNYKIKKIVGLKPSPAQLNTTANTARNGSRLNSAKIVDKNIVIYILPQGNIEKNRIALYKMFPTTKTVTVYFKALCQ